MMNALRDASQANKNVADQPLQRLNIRRVGSYARVAKPAIVLIHGWGSGSWIWQPVLGQLSESFDVWLLDLPGYGENSDIAVASVSDFVAMFGESLEQLPNKFVLLGWSLGGALASLIAGHCRGRVQALVTVATSPSFVRSEEGGVGMEPQVFHRFQEDLNDDSDRLLQRFSMLQSKGGAQFRWCYKFLHDNIRPLDSDCLAQGLHWLKDIDLRQVWPSLNVPVLHIYGKHDALIPAETVSKVEQLCQTHSVELFESSAHLPFVDESAAFINALRCFFARLDKDGAAVNRRVDTLAVQRAFSRAANTYDELATVQRRVANDLLDYLQYKEANACSMESDVKDSVVVDLGSGTGFLRRNYPVERPDCFVQLDISRPMLEHARRGVTGSSGPLLQGDINRLPLHSDSIDLVISSLSIQWCDDLAELFSRVHECLRTKGRFLFSTLLPGSVEELKYASRALGEQPHVHEFVALDTIRQYVNSSGFADARFTEKTYVETFESGRALLASVKGIGAGNHRFDRPDGLLGRQRYQRFIAALEEAASENGELVLTYKVLFADLRK